MCIFSNYSEIFGVINSGFHSYRFLDTAIGDYICTILLAILITYICNIPLVLTTIITLISGVIFHYLFGVNTNTIKYFGLSCK
jgi:hypothetical protein